MGITTRWHGDGLKKLSAALETLGENKARAAFRRAVNEAGGKTKTATGRALADQTGLAKTVTRRALRVLKASNASLEYTLRGSGGDISLKYFKPKETDTGVSAAPFGQRTVYVASFLSGGRWPDGRKGLIAGGHAFYRTGKIKKEGKPKKSGNGNLKGGLHDS